jgi:integrase
MLSAMAGQIISRGKSTWLVRVYIGRDATGKRSYLNKTIHGTKKDAQSWLTSKLRERDMGVAIQPAQTTLNGYLNRWLDSAAKAKVRAKTFVGYKETLSRYVRPELGARPLAKIAPVDVQALYNKLRETGLSPRTIQYTNMILKQAFKQAIHWRLVAFNPCDGVTLPKQVRREMQVLPPDQARRFLAVARADRYAALYELALTTGLRPSEYCGLKWSDVDLERGVVSIARSLDWLPGGGWQFDETKTGRSRRVVKLLASVVQALAQHKARQEAQRSAAGDLWTDHDLVFTNETGGPVDRHNLANRSFRRILKAAELPVIRLYDLRHTAATLALAAGVPIKVVSEMLGHASSALTMDVYSHVLPHMQDDAAARMEALLWGQRETGTAVPAAHTRTQGRRRHTMGTQRPS